MTAAERRLLDYITEFQVKHRYAPSFEEMRESLGIASKSGVHRLLTSLERQGCLVREYGRKRNVKLVPERPDLSAISDADIAEEFRRRFILAAASPSARKIGLDVAA